MSEEFCHSNTTMDITAAGSTLLRCDICHITLTDSNTLESHFTGKKHMKAVRNVDLRAQQEGKAVYLTRLGELRLPEVHNYMSTFGTVVNMAIGENKSIPGRLHHIIVEFESEEVVPVILAKNMRDKHKIPIPGSDPPNFQAIKIYERKFKERARSPTPPTCSSVSHDQVKLRLSLIDDCEDQLEELVSLTHLSPEDVALRVDICRNMQKTFSRTEFSGCVIYPFGSSVSGLGFPGCDLDIFLDLGEPHQITSPNSSLMKDVPITMTEQQKVKSAMKVLREIPQCSRLQPVLGARVPILKFIHRPTGIHCDISFKNRASVRNTEYIRFCLEMDRRVRPLMVAVRYLTRHYNLTGGGGGLKMSNYALTMCVILYLQQLSEPILHTVYELQGVEGLDEDIINGWNCNFCQDLNNLPPLPLNKSSSLELLIGFLQFFSNLEFANVVLCPLKGKVMSKEEFQSSMFISSPDIVDPSSPSYLQTDKPMCLQDPFELSHNVCRNLPEKAVRILAAHMREASAVATSLVSLETRPLGGLKNLFNLEVKVEDCVEENKIESLLEILDDEKKGFFIHSFKILPDKNYLSWYKREVVGQNFVSEESEENDVSGDLVFDAVAYLSEVALGDCLRMIKQDIVMENITNSMCVVKKENDELDKKEMSLSDMERLIGDNEESGVNKDGLKRSVSDGECVRARKRSRQENPLCYRACAEWTVWSKVWAGRRKLGSILEKEKEKLSTVEWEAMLSRKLSEGEFKSIEPEVAFRMHMLVNDITGCVVIGLQKIMSNKKAFESLTNWLTSYLPDVLARLMKEKVVN